MFDEDSLILDMMETLAQILFVVKLTYSVDAIDINIVNVYENRLVYNEGINP